jgi:hypothetical protein
MDQVLQVHWYYGGSGKTQAFEQEFCYIKDGLMRTKDGVAFLVIGEAIRDLQEFKSMLKTLAVCAETEIMAFVIEAEDPPPEALMPIITSVRYFPRRTSNYH